MSLKRRYLHSLIANDLSKRMVFVGGARQVGKTTLAKIIGKSSKQCRYLNWDNRLHRQSILTERWPPETRFLIFDEVHKYRKWKSHIKGIWDTRERNEKIIVTGSSRLDIYRRGGDSLLGRYHYYRLHPFSVQELTAGGKPGKRFTSQPMRLQFNKKGCHLSELFKFGGFPTPLLSGTERTLKRWQKERFERVFREDIRELENIHSLGQIELLGTLLPSRVGSPLSMNSLVEDVEVSSKTIKNWLELLTRNYYIFRVPPYHRRLDRALKKESKYYLWDWSEIQENGPRFENMLAAHLLKFCDFYQDAFGTMVELHYLRDTAKREVDFLLTWEKKPWLTVECKFGSAKLDSSFRYFVRKLKTRHNFLVTFTGNDDYLDKNDRIRVIPAEKFLMALV